MKPKPFEVPTVIEKVVECHGNLARGTIVMYGDALPDRFEACLREDFPRSEPTIMPPIAGCLASFFTEGAPIPQGGKNFDRRHRFMSTSILELLKFNLLRVETMQSIFSILRSRYWHEVSQHFSLYDHEDVRRFLQWPSQ